MADDDKKIYTPEPKKEKAKSCPYCGTGSLIYSIGNDRYICTDCAQQLQTFEYEALAS